MPIYDANSISPMVSSTTNDPEIAEWLRRVRSLVLGMEVDIRRLWAMRLAEGAPFGCGCAN